MDMSITLIMVLALPISKLIKWYTLNMCSFCISIIPQNKAVLKNKKKIIETNHSHDLGKNSDVSVCTYSTSRYPIFLRIDG